MEPRDRGLPPMRYLTAQTLDDALEAMEGNAARQGPERLQVIAGGTDVYPALSGRPLRRGLLDVSRIPGLRGIAETGEGWRIGAATTWTDLIEAPLPPAFDALKAAAREVGSVQIQNAGTVAGNLCNASPAADGVPPLLALDAAVELRSRAGGRTVRLEDFLLGVRETALGPDELMVAVRIPARRPCARSAFLKLGARRYLVISIAMVAVLLEAGPDGRVAHARVAVGACSPVARRLPGLEARLVGHPMTSGALAAVPTPEDLAPLSPIDDVRGSADYRHEGALELIRRALAEASCHG